MYPRCDNKNAVCVNVIPWYDIKSGYDVIYSAYGVRHAEDVISYVHKVSCHQSSGFDNTDIFGIMSDTVMVLSFIHHVRCHIH